MSTIVDGGRVLLDLVEEGFTGIVYRVEECGSGVACYRLFFRDSRLEAMSIASSGGRVSVDGGDRDLLVKLLLTPVEELSIVPGAAGLAGGDGAQPVDEEEWRIALSVARKLLGYMRGGAGRR